MSGLDLDRSWGRKKGRLKMLWPALVTRGNLSRRPRKTPVGLNCSNVTATIEKENDQDYRSTENLRSVKIDEDNPDNPDNLVATEN
jgi:hypothetical protein